MKALFIGGTGTISSAISKLAIERDWELYLLNRGNKIDRIPAGAKVITADINDEDTIRALTLELDFDVIVDFIAYVPEQLKRDVRLFKNKTKQFIFISSASAYQKPLSNYKITESTPLCNPYWKYSRDKIAGEEFLMEQYRQNGFPVTIIRPSHTYDERNIPVAVHGKKGSWQVIDRILRDRPVIIPGDGSSLWTLTHNSDFAKAFLGLMGNPAAIGESFQITSDESLTWDKIYDIIGEALNKKVNKFHIASDFLAECDCEFKGSLIGDKSNTVVFDNSKIKKIVPDFLATTRFDQGIRKSIEYILKHPELQILDEEFDYFCEKLIKVQEEALTNFKKIN